MQKVRKDISGQVFGQLTVAKYSHTDKDKKAVWECLCSCGTVKQARGGDLRSGKIISCGCFHKRMVGDMFSKHNLSTTQEYSIWADVKQRCTNPNNHAYSNYGGRGITMCDRWLNSFENFLEDIGERPSKKHSIDRMNNDKGYSKENCRWATSKEQNENQRTNRLVVNKETGVFYDTISQAAFAHGVKYGILHSRLRRETKNNNLIYA